MDRRRRLLYANNYGGKTGSVGPPAPTLVSLNVSSGDVAGGTAVVATGTNLTGASAVSVGGNPATAVSALDASHVQFTTPAGSAGAASITVTTPGGTSAPLVGAFTYVAAPTLVSLDKPYSQATGGVVRVGTGTALGSVTGVTVGGTNATSISSTPTTVTFTTPSGTAGPADVVVTTAAGSFTLTGGLIYYSVIAPVGTQPIASGTNGGTTAAADMSLATLLAAAISYASASPTVSDSSTNTWLKRTAEASTFSHAQLAYVANPTVTSTQTATVAGTNMYGAIAFAGFSGVATASPYDTEATGAAVSAGLSVTVGSLTPSNPGSLLLAACIIEKTQLATLTVDSGFTILGSLNSSSVSGIAIAYTVQTDPVAVAPKFSWTNQTSNAAVVMAAFRPFVGVTPILNAISLMWGTNAGGDVVTISGSNLSGATVTVDGNAGTSVSTTSTSITFTVPSSAKVNTAVDVLVTNNGHTVGTGNGWFRYMAARTTTYLATGFESGMPGAPFSTFADGTGSVAITTAKAHSGTHSLLCTAETTTNYAAASITDGTNAPLNNTHGVYLSWWQYTPDTTVTAAQGGQVKLHLDRNTGAGQPGWLMGIFGIDANSYGSSQQAAFFIDDGILPIIGGGGPILGDAAGWIHFQLYYNRKAGSGNAILAANGTILFNTSSAVLGSDTSTDVYGPTLGIAYQQTTTGETTVYLDDIDYADGF